MPVGIEAQASLLKPFGRLLPNQNLVWAGCPTQDLPGPAFLRHHPNASAPEIGGL